MFSRYYSCALCKLLLAKLTAQYPALRLAGYDLKVVLQSRQSAVAKSRYPFDLVCDPDAKLYDRYNVFEADSAVSMVATSPQLIRLMGGTRELAMNMFSDEPTEGRARQLPGVFLVDPDMTVRYAYYGRTADDVPDLLKLVALKKQ